ncbi:hypothetical protein [Devosia enhydra]|nr:hypothetical protein [Devosia enhydra]
MTRLGLAALLTALSATLAMAQTPLPIVSDATVADGQAAPFEGNWSIMKPGGDRTSETDSCAMPASIQADGPTAITYASSTGAEFSFALADENDATTWQGEFDRIAVWQGPDAFLLYSRLADGTPDTAEAYLYERCPIWPRTSYEGAVPGALEPFVGAWQEAVPPARGAEPLQIVGACNDPTIFEISGPTTLKRTIAGQPDYTLEIRARGTDTVVPNPRAGYAPSVIVWVSPDRFHFHIIDIFGGTNWFSPVIYTRCAP